MRRPFSVMQVGVLMTVGMLLATPLMSSWVAPLRASASPLSQDAVVSDITPVAQVAPDRTVIRSRFVALDVETLPDPRERAQLSREPGLSLELFPDVRVDAVFDRFDTNASGVTWVGHLANTPGSSVTLVYGGGVLTGAIVAPQGFFQIRPASEAARQANPQPVGAMHEITQVDQSAFLREADPLEAVLPSESLASDSVVMADAGDVVDVMVVYTATAQQHAGGAAAMTNLINLSVSETNTSYINSDIALRLRLVHTVQVDYTEVSNFGTNLSNLRVGTGGGLTGVAALRDQYGADLVTMLIHPTSPSACGIAYVMTTVSTAFSPFGYSVTDTACLSPNFTFAHELGHNMGAQHDWYVTAATLPFTYAHGFVNTDAGFRWRTIMSYNDRCSVQGFNCSRLLSWANPENRLNPFCAAGNFTCRTNLWYLPGSSIPLGVRGGTKSDCRVGQLSDTGCDADNRRALNNTALTVANLRASVSSQRSTRR
jgi:peptidyl-Asp metalloendopeptidase